MQVALQDNIEFSIDELARRAGMTVRNVRAYQTRGLLPPPLRLGRGRATSAYGPEHVDRLEKIALLRKRGFSLAAIAELADARKGRVELDGSLGRPGAERPTIFQDESPVVASRDDLEKLLPGAGERPELLARAISSGVLVPRGDEFVVTSPTVFRLGVELSRLGIPFSDVLDLYESVAEAADRLTTEFARTFRENVWEPSVDDGLKPERLAEITDVLKLMPAMTADAVQVIFGRAVEKAGTLSEMVGDE